MFFVGKYSRFLAILLIIAFFVSGCSSKGNIQTDNTKIQEQSEEDKTQKTVEDFKNKYSAVEINYENDDNNFSAEIVDKFKGKNIYLSIMYIEDVFYSDEDLYMYVDSWGDSKFLFKITQEQYSTIRAMHNDIDYDIHAIFTLDNIESMLPSLEADFEFYISGPDDVSSDEYASLSLDSRIIHGTLVDIIEVH